MKIVPHDPSCPAVTSSDMHPCVCGAEHEAEALVSPEECEAAGGHAFEVVGDPPYRCTFCDLRHDQSEGGKYTRPSRN